MFCSIALNIGLCVYYWIVKYYSAAVVFTVMYDWAIHGVLGASVAVDVYNTLVTCILLAKQRDGLQQYVPTYLALMLLRMSCRLGLRA